VSKSSDADQPVDAKLFRRVHAVVTQGPVPINVMLDNLTDVLKTGAKSTGSVRARWNLLVDSHLHAGTPLTALVQERMDSTSSNSGNQTPGPRSTADDHARARVNYEELKAKHEPGINQDSDECNEFSGIPFWINGCGEPEAVTTGTVANCGTEIFPGKRDLYEGHCFAGLTTFFKTNDTHLKVNKVGFKNGSVHVGSVVRIGKNLEYKGYLLAHLVTTIRPHQKVALLCREVERIGKERRGKPRQPK
jgi:hypothetical protein